MLDVFYAIAACDDLIHYWDVAKQSGGGVLLRASSQRHFASEEEAVEIAHEIAHRVRPSGYHLRTISAAARTNGSTGDGWHSFVEVLIAAEVGTATS